jgi:hypothetical protein
VSYLSECGIIDGGWEEDELRGDESMPGPIEVKAGENYQIWIKYSDGIQGVVDLSDLVGKGVFAVWKD